MQRREMLLGTGMAIAAGAIWAAVRQFADADAATATAAVPADTLFDAVCDLVIPDTDTPGAKSAGVGAFLALALPHGLAGASMGDRSRLETLLDTAAGGSFVALPRDRQQSVLTSVDATAFAQADSVWPRIKKLILMGYYTSEIGASRELQYQLVPGRFDTDLPVKPGDRAWSSDWVGQGF
jgi:hypothetical protein